MCTMREKLPSVRGIFRIGAIYRKNEGNIVMLPYHHHFHIPVMGTGFSTDTPIRVAPFGINSVISLVDDILLEKLREHYCVQYDLPYVRIARAEPDARARHITAYLDTVDEIVKRKFDELRRLPFFEENDKKKYFDLLPLDVPARVGYDAMLQMESGPAREERELELNRQMIPGSIDVNIMVKLDRVNVDKNGANLGDEFSDAKAALRGYAHSRVRSNIIFSAGINQTLFSYMTRFPDFYRDDQGIIKKKIIIKVSDFRSALIQGKFLAKKGLEVSEFRIESGLNCGGHAFPSNGVLLPMLLKEFRAKRDQLITELQPMIAAYYANAGRKFEPSWLEEPPLVTVQGGIGTAGEVRRLREDFGIDRTGWATPFLLVPEATSVDDTTRELLRKASKTDLYVSRVSPLGVPFNNIRCSTSEQWTARRAATAHPGSSCPKGFLKFNTEFTELPLCTASQEYQALKLDEIERQTVSPDLKETQRSAVLEKTCICDHLGNGSLISHAILEERFAPSAICPGPNIAWFSRTYSLLEMVDHIYGRGECLVPSNRPHMFAKEVEMYVDYFEYLSVHAGVSAKDRKTLDEFHGNLHSSMDYCSVIAGSPAYPQENLQSLASCLNDQRIRLDGLYKFYRTRSEELHAA